MYFLESLKGRRHLLRAARKRGGKAAKRGTSKEQIPVLVVRDRHGETDDRMLRDTSAEQVGAMLIHLFINVTWKSKTISISNYYIA